MKRTLLLLGIALPLCTFAQNSGNLIEGGDMERAGYTYSSMPENWMVSDGIKVVHADYENPKDNYCYLQLTPVVGGYLKHFVYDSDSRPAKNGFKVETWEDYTVTFRAKSEQANTIKLKFEWWSGQNFWDDVFVSEPITIEGDWKEYKMVVKTIREENAVFSVLFETANGDIAFDDFTMTKGAEVVDIPEEFDVNNLFRYGSFEYARFDGLPKGWYSTNTAYASLVSTDLRPGATGTKALKIYPNGRLQANIDGEWDVLKVAEGKNYDLTFWAKGGGKDKVSVKFKWKLNKDNAGVFVSEPIAISSAWEQYKLKIKVPFDVTSAEFSVEFLTDEDYLYFDDFELRLATTSADEDEDNDDNETPDDEVTIAEGVFQVEGLFYKLAEGQEDAVVVTCESEGEDNYTQANRPTGAIVVPATIQHDGKTYQVVGVAKSAFSECKGITSVELPVGVNTIGHWAFGDCAALESVVLPEGLTEIGNEVFENCTQLRHLLLPASLKEVGARAFKNCTGLETVTALMEDPAKVNVGENAFFHVDRSTVKIIVPEGKEGAYLSRYPWSSFANVIPTSVNRIAVADADVATHGHALVVKISAPQTVRVFAANGTEVLHQSLAAGTHTLPLASGIYVVKVGTAVFKTVVR